jgi:HEAT repeat protein
VELLIAALRDQDDNVRKVAAGGLLKLGGSAAEPLIAALLDQDYEVRELAAQALRELGEPAVEPLIAALLDQDSKVRQLAAKLLGELGNTRAVEPLVAALQDEAETVRNAAAVALGEIGDPRAVEPLVTALRNVGMSLTVQYSLRMLGQPAVGPLIAALKDGDWRVRVQAAKALGEFGDARAVESLLAALEDEAPIVHWEIVEVLRRIGTPEAQAALRKAGL